MANERNAGAKKKFPLQKTKQLQIKRVVPEVNHDDWKKKVNELINQLQTQALDKCVAENYKRNGNK